MIVLKGFDLPLFRAIISNSCNAHCITCCALFFQLIIEQSDGSIEHGGSG